MRFMRSGMLSMAVLAVLAAVPAFAVDEAPRLRPGEPIPPAELEAFVDGVVAAAMAEHRIVGVTVSAVQGGEVVLSKGYGFADLEAGRRVDPDKTLFRIGSISKTFTWIEIMKLVEAGELALDDPANDHLPPELRVPDQGYETPIRVRDLMTHQAGFEDRALGSAADKPEDVRPLADFLRDARPNRVRPPGELSCYSNYGAALAGAIIEHETGRAWQDIVEDDILVPLSMTHTSTREPYPARDDLPAPMADALAEDASLGYRVVGASPQAEGYTYLTQIAPAGAVSSTASDMARYMLMQLADGELDGARIYGAQAAQAFRTPMTSRPREAGDWDGGFGEAHGPGNFRGYGHDGGMVTFFSMMMVFPKLDLGLFVSTNTVSGASLSGGLCGQVVQHFYAPPPAAPLAGRPEPGAEMAAYAGQYLQTRRRYGGLEGFIGRLGTFTLAVSSDGYPTVVAPTGVRFVPADQPDRFRSANGPRIIVFEQRDARLTLPADSYVAERVGPLDSPQTLFAIAAFVVLASLGALLGVRVRAGRGLPSTTLQKRAGQLQIAASVLWLASLVSLGVFAAGAASDPGALLVSWPTPPMLAFSTLALLASLASAGVLVMLPMVWTRVGGWSRWRKTRFTATTVIFMVFALFLLSWGALQPWNP